MGLGSSAKSWSQRDRRRELGGKQPANLWEKNEADMEFSVLKRDRRKLGGAVLSKKYIGGNWEFEVY